MSRSYDAIRNAISQRAAAQTSAEAARAASDVLATDPVAAPDSEPGFSPTESADHARGFAVQSGSMARVGCSTTFTGKIVADEDIEVQGTVEGSIVLDRHQLTVGVGGVVQADVEANSVLVIGRVIGNVTATDVVEVKSGGYIGRDVTAPRIIMADGAFVMGALDMASGLPKKLSRLP
jgi:cytoskeletal protein CcmA (bactofilin family)